MKHTYEKHLREALRGNTLPPILTIAFHVGAWLVPVGFCCWPKAYAGIACSTATTRSAFPQYHGFVFLWEWASWWKSFRHLNRNPILANVVCQATENKKPRKAELTYLPTLLEKVIKEYSYVMECGA